MREQFPFLRKVDCPGVLKELVNDLITCFEIYTTNQVLLHDVMTAPERKAIAGVVRANYILNKLAYKELDYYKVNASILGKHPIFERRRLKAEISALNGLELSKKITALSTNIFRNKQKQNTELVARDEDLLLHAESVLKGR